MFGVYTRFSKSQVESTLTIALILSILQRLQWKTLWKILWISCGRNVDVFLMAALTRVAVCGNPGFRKFDDCGKENSIGQKKIEMVFLNRAKQFTHV